MGSLPRWSISRIAIVGAGPSGIAAAKYMLAEKAFEKIDILEQRREVGGVWKLTSNVLSKKTPIPQLDPNYHVEKPYLPVPQDRAEKSLSEQAQIDPFESPLYDMLETNIPKSLMRYSDLAFADDLPLFPRHEDVLDYCRQYAEDVKELIKFPHRVTDVHPVLGREHQDHTSESEGTAPSWSVTTLNEATQSRTTDTYDAVLIASGHYAVPYVPAIKGVNEWSSAYPDTIIHSKAYRNPDQFANKKVIVVGNSASGIDIGAQIGRVCKQPLLQSSRTETKTNTLFSAQDESDPPTSWKEPIGEIVEFLPPTAPHPRSVRLSNNRIITDLDAIVFATGYLYSFPFLQLPSSPAGVVTSSGQRTRDIYQQLLHIKYRTLAFAVLPQRIIPFPMAENQAAVVARL
jgi:cation diffusion facilitator CzcD-associated flavoprotein CzcO